MSNNFDERKHPREKGGKFARKPEGTDPGQIDDLENDNIMSALGRLYEPAPQEIIEHGTTNIIDSEQRERFNPFDYKPSSKEAKDIRKGDLLLKRDGMPIRVTDAWNSGDGLTTHIRTADPDYDRMYAADYEVPTAVKKPSLNEIDPIFEREPKGPTLNGATAAYHGHELNDGAPVIAQVNGQSVNAWVNAQDDFVSLVDREGNEIAPLFSEHEDGNENVGDIRLIDPSARSRAGYDQFKPVTLAEAEHHFTSFQITDRVRLRSPEDPRNNYAIDGIVVSNTGKGLGILADDGGIRPVLTNEYADGSVDIHHTR